MCSRTLDIANSVVTCPAGHSFDVARQGYVNLLGSAPPGNADTVAMIAARGRFLASGIYDPIGEAVTQAVRYEPRFEPGTVVEAGAGTAWYLARVLDTLPQGRGVALDVSVAACRKAASSHPRAAAVVADTWRSLPLVDAAADVVLCVFAPRNLPEFGRVLAAGGVLVVVYPNPGHLEGLRRSYGLLDVDPHKAERLSSMLSGWRLTTRVVRFETSATPDQVSDLVLMGPNAFHDRIAPRDPASLCIDVTVVCASRP